MQYFETFNIFLYAAKPYCLLKTYQCISAFGRPFVVISIIIPHSNWSFNVKQTAAYRLYELLTGLPVDW